MIAILYTDGQMNHRDIESECVQQKWLPILLYKKNGLFHVPLFNDFDVAKTFIRRNLPKMWTHGSVLLTETDLQNMVDRGWVFDKMTFPRKMLDVVEFCFEVHELDTTPDFSITHTRI